METVRHAWVPQGGDRAPSHRAPGARLIQHKIRRQASERQDFICNQVRKMLEAGFIREVIPPEWLANPVVVPRPTTNFACAPTTATSTWPAQKILFRYPASTKLSTPCRGVTSFAFWTHTPGTPRLAWQRRTRRKHCSCWRSLSTHFIPCLSLIMV